MTLAVLVPAFKLGLFLATIVLIAYIAACVFLLLRQNRFIFMPSPFVDRTPEDLGLSYEEVWIPVPKTFNTQKLHGWWIPVANPKGVVLHLHGNGFNIGANLDQTRRFHKLGYSVLLADYRGYGRSQGPFPNEKRVYEDAEAIWQYLVQTLGASPAEIVLYGHSLGGAIAIDLAAKHPEAAGLIVQSSFTRMQSVVERVWHLWMFPVSLLLTQHFKSIEKVRSLQMPVLFTHGTLDQVVPPEMSPALYAAAPQPKELLMVEGADHNNVGEVGGEAYLQVLQRFLASTRPAVMSSSALR